MRAVTTTPPRATPSAARPGLLALLLLAAAPALARPAPAPAPTAGPPAALALPDDELPAPEAPPELEARDVQKMGRAIKKFTSGKTKARRAAEADVLEFGRGAIPHLVAEAATTSPEKQDSVARCLLALADMRDWDVVEASVGADEVALRRFAARKAGELGLAHLAPELEERLDDEDRDVRLEAAVALARLGSEAGLGALADVYRDIFRLERDLADDGSRRDGPELDDDEREKLLDQGERLREALAGLAEHGDHDALVARLTSDPKREKTDPEGAALDRQSAVALLAAVGDAAAIRGLASALDDAHNVVQRDAIDALRAIVEDAPPFDGASIFQQINEVKRLKDVLARRR